MANTRRTPSTPVAWPTPRRPVDRTFVFSHLDNRTDLLCVYRDWPTNALLKGFIHLSSQRR
jgi:hypothetical protein